MKCSPEKLLELENALKAYKTILTEKSLNKITGIYNKFYGSFHSLFTTLSSEKIISVDPYGDEYNLKALEPPDNSEIPYNEEDYIMSIRLTHFYALLTHLKQKDIFSIDTLTIKTVEKIEILLGFMDWDRIFDPQPREVNTEGLNKILFLYQKDIGQKYIIATLQAATSDIYRYSLELLEELNKIKLFLNEEYKLRIRNEVLPLTKFPPELQGQNIKKAHDIITENIKALKMPLYIELIGEVLKEDFSSEGDDIKKDILNKLKEDNYSTGEKKTKVIKTHDPIELLKSSFTEISKAESQMGSILIKQIGNDEMYRIENYSFFDKIIDFIKFTIIGTKRNTLYKIEIPENNNDVPKSKSLEFDKFITSVQELSRTLDKIKNTENLQNIIEKGEEEIQRTLHQLLSKCRYTYKILFSLNIFFKKNLNVSKGIQIELKVLLSAIDKAQTIYFEYTKQKSDGKSNSTTYKPDIDLTT